MNLIPSGCQEASAIDIETVAGMIAGEQSPSGEIPWHRSGKTDPWDHVEAAMGLCIGTRLAEARQAFQWLAAQQNADGSWYAAYRNGVAQDLTRDTNMSAYIAVGLYHYYLVTGDKGFICRMWPTLRAAMDFAARMQAKTGQIYWALSPQGQVDPMALLTGSSSVAMSFKCALAIAKALGREMLGWQQAHAHLITAIGHRPDLFNMTKSRYSMDWYYPVLCGALTGDEAQHRIDRYWKKFVIEGQGVRCVSDQPWVTVAETCELVLALEAMGNRSLAEIVFGWISPRRYEDGAFWCGYTFPDMTVWPKERLTWTNAVVLMAADALFDLTPAAGLFRHHQPQGIEPAGPVVPVGSGK